MNKRTPSKSEPKGPSISIIVLGAMVRYYYEGTRKGSGWKHGHVLEIKPRKKEARIQPIGPGPARWVNLSNVEAIEA